MRFLFSIFLIFSSLMLIACNDENDVSDSAPQPPQENCEIHCAP